MGMSRSGDGPGDKVCRGRLQAWVDGEVKGGSVGFGRGWRTEVTQGPKADGVV